MWLTVLYIWGSLVAFSECHVCPETSEDIASWVTLKPLGHCGDKDNSCPYRLTLPPLSIELPRPFRELEKMAKELQDLKDMVNDLRRDCQECKDRAKGHSEEREKRPQSLSITETQSHSGEQAVRILTSTLLQGDTSESEGTVKDGVKRLNHSILERMEWNTDPRTDLNQGTADQRSETSREVKLLNPLLDETPEDISKVKLVLSPTPEEAERELKSKRSEFIEPSRTSNVQSHGKQQPNILRDGHAKNISGILMARRRVQNVHDPNELSDANSKTMDLRTSAGNRRVVKFPGTGGQLRPRGSYINGRVVKITSEDRLKNPTLVRIPSLQSGDMAVKTEPEKDGYSPVRSGVMRVKEPSPHIANTKTGVPSTDDQNNQAIRFSGLRTDDRHGLKDASQETTITEDNSRKVSKTGITRLPTNLSKDNQGDVSHLSTNRSISSVMKQAEQPNIVKEGKTGVPSTDDQNNQAIRFSGPRTDDRHGLKDASQETKITEDNSRKISKTGTTRLPTNLSKDNQGDVSHVSRNRSISSVMKQAEQPNIVKEGKTHMGLSEGLVVISSEEETSSSLNREDLTFPGQQVKNKKYPLVETKNRQADLKIWDKERRVLVGKSSSQAGDMKVKNEPEEAEFPPARSDDIQVKETSPHIASTKPETISGLTLSTDDQNKQDISRFSASRTDDRHGLKDASQVTKVKDDILRKVDKTAVTPLPTTLRKENQGDVSHTATNKSISSVMNRGEEPNMVKEEKQAEISSSVDKEDLTFSGRQVDIEKYLNPITKTNLRQIDSTILDKADTAFNERTVNPLSPDLEDQTQPGTFNGGTNGQKTDIPKPTLVPSVKSKSADSRTSRIQTPVVGQGIMRTSITPLKAPAKEGFSQNSKIHEVNQDNKRYVMLNPDRHPIRRPTTVISSRVNKLRQPNVTDNMSANRSAVVHSKPSFPVRNSYITRRNGSGIVRPSYIRRPNFQTEPSRGFKTKVNALTQFPSPTGATEQEQTEDIKHIPQGMRSTGLESQPDSQNSGDAQDLDKVRQGKNQVRDDSETVLISNVEDPNTLQSGASDSKIFSLESADPSKYPFEVDKISSGKIGLPAPTLKEPGANLLTTSTVAFTDTDRKDSTKNIHKVINTHVEMAKNISWETPLSFENTGATRELELVKFNKDRVEENSGEILSNSNSADTAQGYGGDGYTIPVVLERLTNVEEIKGSKLFSLSPEDTAEGFKSHAASDEVTERENNIHSTCGSDCNATSTQTRTPVESGREKGPAQDCADYITKSQRNGVYRVLLQPRSSMFPVFCDMESHGGGWTLIQHRFDGSTSFNRTWDEYKNGFGELTEEFWLGNDKIHMLTKAKNMSLRIEIEDFEGVKEYAHYDNFSVADESQQYRLSIGGYSGTAGNAMQFSKTYNHDQKLFTTPDRDNDQYPSGNCGAYYSSGWWFDACMSANLNGRYYQSKYKGVRNGIFWGTWHNITMEYYPTNDRQSFKTVKMMIRPKNYAN